MNTPKAQKRQSSRHFFVLMGSLRIKALCKTLMKLTPGVTKSFERSNPFLKGQTSGSSPPPPSSTTRTASAARSATAFSSSTPRPQSETDVAVAVVVNAVANVNAVESTEVRTWAILVGQGVSPNASTALKSGTMLRCKN